MYFGITFVLSTLVMVVSGNIFSWSTSGTGNYSTLCDQTKTFRCNCPPDDTGEVADCTDKRIEDLPSNIQFPDYITIVKFTRNNVKEIPSTVFASGKRVAHLDLSNNRIDFLSGSAFEGLENLQFIDLSHNEIWSLGLGTFRGPHYLMKLDLGYNKLNNFFPDTFKELNELQELTLNNNPILNLDRDSFGFLVALQILDLSSTGLNALPAEVFGNNTKLMKLHLSANSFPNVPSKGIRSAKSLKELDISENPVEEIEKNAFAGLNELKVLKITHMRKLSTLERYSLSGLQSLRELYLTDNPVLKKISGLTFKPEPPPLKATTESETDNSKQEEVEEEDENPNKHPSLVKLSFRHNGLEWLPEDLVDWSQIKELDLRENPWTCDCHLSWIAQETVPKSAKEAARCNAPSRVSGRPLSTLVDSDYTCSYLTSEATVALAVLVVAAFIMALAGVAFVMYRRSMISCRRRSKEPAYVRVVPSKDKVDLEWDHTAEPESRA